LFFEFFVKKPKTYFDNLGIDGGVSAQNLATSFLDVWILVTHRSSGGSGSSECRSNASVCGNFFILQNVSDASLPQTRVTVTKRKLRLEVCSSILLSIPIVFSLLKLIPSRLSVDGALAGVQRPAESVASNASVARTVPATTTTTTTDDDSEHADREGLPQAAMSHRVDVVLQNMAWETSVAAMADSLAETFRSPLFEGSGVSTRSLFSVLL
jgi:hypothetical protein